MSQLKSSFPPDRIGLALKSNYVVVSAKAAAIIVPLIGTIVASVLSANPVSFYVGFFLFLLAMVVLFETRIGKPLWIRLGRIVPDLILDHAGLALPLHRLEWHKFAREIKLEDRKDRVRHISWPAARKLLIERNPDSKYEYIIEADGDQIHISFDELLEPPSFQQAVELFSGKRFEKTFDEREARPVASVPTPRQTPEAIPPGAKRFTVRVSSRESRWSLVGCFARVLIGLVAMGGFVFLFPDFAGRLFDSGYGMMLTIALLLLLVIYPLIPKTPSGNRYFLAIAPEGLYANVPTQQFPQFTPWGDVKDFTLSSPGAGQERQDISGRLQFHRGEDVVGRRFTLYTGAGVYAFSLETLEQEHRFVVEMLQRKRSTPKNVE